MHLKNSSVYASAPRDHLVTNVAGGKTLCLKKTNFPDTGWSKCICVFDFKSTFF